MCEYVNVYGRQNKNYGKIGVDWYVYRCGSL